MSKKDTMERVAESLAQQLDSRKERCAALVEAINVTGAREAGSKVPLPTILEYAFGFLAFMTGDEKPRTVH